MSQKKIYFTAGPATIPAEVMQQVHSEFLDFQGIGCSIIEVSHRSQTFSKILDEAEGNLRKLMQIPDNCSVLFLHGGAQTQFDSIAMNLCSELDAQCVDYIINGYWSQMAAKCADKYAKVNKQVFKHESFDCVPKQEEIKISDGSRYCFYCDNETIQGLEYNYVPDSSSVPLVCDMTSNFLSRPVDVEKFGVIFASSQKNCGTSGLAIVIVKNDLLGKQMSFTPSVQNYLKTKESKSVGNTPPIFQIYLANLCFKWILKQGGLSEMDELSKQKSSLLYKAIDESNGFYYCPVDKSFRSRMNVIYLLKDNTLLEKFIDEAKQAGLYELKGHRSSGGLRASLYHGITLDDVKRLIEFMQHFQAKYKQ